MKMVDCIKSVEDIFKVKKKLVRISFTDTDKTAEDSLTNVLKNLYK